MIIISLTICHKSLCTVAELVKANIFVQGLLVVVTKVTLGGALKPNLPSFPPL